MHDPILGAHMSIAGGYYKAVEAARAAGCCCVQLFTKNNNQWRAKPITVDEAERFRAQLQSLQITHPLSHSSYLLNLASSNPELWQRSVDALVVELQRAEQLTIPYVVIHPGACVSCTEEAGIAAVIQALRQVLEQTPDLRCGILLETTAGQGSSLGHRFEHLAAILTGVGTTARVACCVDTCHVFAAGYPLSDRKDYLATMREFDRLIGLEQIKAFHLNDSKKALGSRVDRHEHIGRGMLGLEPFRHLLNDSRFRDVPMYMETPKGTGSPGTMTPEAKDQKEGTQVDAEEDFDVINLRTLRGLLTVPKRSAKSQPA